MVLRKDIKELDGEVDLKAEPSLKPGEHLHWSHGYPFHCHSTSVSIQGTSGCFSELESNFCWCEWRTVTLSELGVF